MSTISANFLFSKAFRWMAVTAIAPLVFLGLAPAQAAPSATLSGISQQKFECMKRNRSNSQGSVTYAGGNSGRITVFRPPSTWLGEKTPVDVGAFNFNFVLADKTLTVTWVRGLVTTERLRDGLQNTASNTCKNIQ